jgi:hypothetical protein
MIADRQLIVEEFDRVYRPITNPSSNTIEWEWTDLPPPDQINERQWWTVRHQAWHDQPKDPHERYTWFLVPGLVGGSNNLFLLRCEVEWSGKREDHPHHVYNYNLEDAKPVEFGGWAILPTRRSSKPKRNS